MEVRHAQATALEGVEEFFLNTLEIRFFITIVISKLKTNSILNFFRLISTISKFDDN